MGDQYVVCPGCGRRIPVTEAFSRQIEERLRKEFEAEVRRKEKEHEAALAAKEKEFDERLQRERGKLEARARKQAEDAIALEVQDLKRQLEDKSKKLEHATRQELALRRRQQELEEREQNLKLEVHRTLDRERKRIQEEATARALEEHRLKDREKDMQLAAMREQIEDLKRKAEQGSQQAQGEALEMELEELLRSQFRTDEIEPVAKGTRGADALQRVRGPGGKVAGTILWESKRTKSWNDAWIQKLKDDQREAKADLAVIVSTALPKEIQRIGHIDGVWVADFSSVIGLATALRASVIQVAQARSALVGKTDKMELLYNYLSGPEFRQRIEAIVESFTAMKEDLEAERRAMERQWAKRDKQITRVIQSTSSMYGDLQGIIGASLAGIPVLELPSGAPPTEQEEELPF